MKMKTGKNCLIFCLIMLTFVLVTSCDPFRIGTALQDDYTSEETDDYTSEETDDDSTEGLPDDTEEEQDDTETSDDETIEVPAGDQEEEPANEPVDERILPSGFSHHHILYDISSIGGSIVYTSDAPGSETTTNFEVTTQSEAEGIRISIGLPDIDSRISFTLTWSEGTGYAVLDNKLALYDSCSSPYLHYNMGDEGLINIISLDNESLGTVSLSNTADWWLSGFDNHEEIITDLNIILSFELTGYLALNIESELTAEELRFLDTGSYRERADSETLTLLESDPETGLALYIEEIMDGVDDTGIKLKILYDFIIHYLHYDWDAYTTGSGYITAPYEVLPIRRTVCSGYARLLGEAAGLAGLPVFYTSGGAKGYSYDDEAELPGHAWNFVKYNGEYYLLDATWDSAGRYQNSEYFDGTESWKYFLVEPENMIANHLPDDELHQFLDSPITETEFRSSDGDGGNPTYITEEFFNYNVAFAEGGEPDFSAENGYSSFLVETSYPVSAYSEGVSVFKDAYDDGWEIHLSFPDEGSYTVYLSLIDDEQYVTAGVYRYISGQADPNSGFITRYSSADEYGFDLIAPVPYSFDGDSPHLLSFTTSAEVIPGVWYYNVDGDRLDTAELNSSADGTEWTALLTPPEGTNRIIILRYKEETNTWSSVYIIPYGETAVAGISAPRGLGTPLPVLPEFDPKSRPTMPVI